MSKFFQLIQQLWQHRYMIRTMAVHEIRSRYVGSIIGVFWSIVYPVTMVFVYWFIFSLGFKVQPNAGVPFVIWFFCAFIPWTTFNEMISMTTNSVIANQSLIKRTTFPSEILPFVHLVSSTMTHLIMLVILLIMLWINDLSLSLYAFQFIYYWVVMVIGMVGFGWILAALNVFFRDVGQIVTVFLQVWFWATPIFWQLSMIPERFHFLLKLNPFFHIVEGYRNSFLYHQPFWDSGYANLYLWGVAILFFVIGGLTFRHLKRDFADVL